MQSDLISLYHEKDDVSTYDMSRDDTLSDDIYDGSIAKAGEFVTDRNLRTIRWLAGYGDSTVDDETINEHLEWLTMMYNRHPELFTDWGNLDNDGFIELEAAPTFFDAKRSLYLRAEFTKLRDLARETTEARTKLHEEMEKVRQAEEKAAEKARKAEADHQKWLIEQVERAEYLRLNPPVPKVRVKRDPTESEIKRVLDYMLSEWRYDRLEYPHDPLPREQPTERDAIASIIKATNHWGREKGRLNSDWRDVDYIMPLPEMGINPFLRRTEIRLTPNARLEGIDLILHVKSMLTMIYGDTNSGKSTLMLHTSHQFAAMGHKTWYISTEDSLDIIRERADVMRSEYSTEEQQAIDENLVFSSMDTLREFAEANGYEDFAFDLLDDDTGDLIRQIVEEYEIDTLFLDTLSGATLANESDNAQMNKAMRILVDLSINKVRVIFAHHTKKSADKSRDDQAYSGAGTILRRVIDAFFLQAVGNKKITLANSKAKATAKGDYQTYMISYRSVDEFDENGEPITANGRVMQLASEAVVTPTVESGTRKEKILAYLASVDSAETAVIAKEVELETTNVSTLLGELVTAKEAKRIRRGVYSII